MSADGHGTMSDPKFTLYWRPGDREVASGRTIAEAMTLAGYSNGAVRALDFYAKGDDREWRWLSVTREWVAATTNGEN